MNTQKKNITKLFNGIISGFLSKKEIKEFKIITSTNLDSKNSINENVNSDTDFLLKIELLITFAQQKLDASNYAEFLISLGNFAQTLGENDLATTIYESLLSYSKSNKQEFGKANIYYKLAEIYFQKSMWKTSFSYISKAKKIFKTNNDISGVSKCLNLLGTIYGEMGDCKKAIQNFEASLKFLTNSNDIETIGKVEINLGIVNTIIGENEKAKDYHRKALLRFSKKEDYKRIAEIYHNLGMIQLNLKNLKEAIYEFDNCIHFCMKINYLPILGIAYLGKASSMIFKNDVKLAEQLADKAAFLFNKTKDRLSLADVYKIKGMIYRKKKKYNKAEFYLNTSLRLNIEIGNKLNEAETNIELGILFFDLGKKKEGKNKFNQALKYYTSIRANDKIKEIENLKNSI